MPVCFKTLDVTFLQTRDGKLIGALYTLFNPDVMSFTKGCDTVSPWWPQLHTTTWHIWILSFEVSSSKLKLSTNSILFQQNSAFNFSFKLFCYFSIIEVSLLHFDIDLQGSDWIQHLIKTLFKHQITSKCEKKHTLMGVRARRLVVWVTHVRLEMIGGRAV